MSCIEFCAATAAWSTLSSRSPKASIVLLLSAARPGACPCVSLRGVAPRLGRFQALYVNDQRHIAVAQDGAASDPLDRLEVFLQRFDHHLLLADDVVDDQRHLD